MGLFLALSGVANSHRAAGEEALCAFAAGEGGTMEAVAPSPDTSATLLIAESGGNVSVMYPDGFLKWDEASQHLSRVLDTSVFSLHVHDGDLWMYILFSRGETADQFNPIPAYWSDDISDKERRAWTGNANLVAQHWPGAKPESIEKYLTQWNLEERESGKAYSDDRFSYNDCWQMTDFMRRVGLVYPIDDEGKPHATTYHFVIKDRRIRNR